ncbi:hypothetical protein [Risungbinella massiliensis]|uniref:hypothetical protein n=1 Tax=Risungbinella massiliensis TaxID=1329796 RepID=UPI0005CC1356|nr:hypothetical protein [Risungbinella massiliensis]
MYQNPYKAWKRQTSPPARNQYSVIDQKVGDVTGDHVPDIVSLIGTSSPSGPFIQNVTIIVQDGRTRQSYPIHLPTNSGYGPTLFLGDFTGDRVNDILVRMDSGGSGGFTYDYIFSFVNHQTKMLFNYEQFNKETSYEVDYLDHYRVRVRNITKNQSLVLDITWKGPEYLSEIYNQNGTLKAPIKGWVNALGGLYPVDYNRDGINELLAYQRVVGRYNADGLGDLLTVLNWNKSQFVPARQEIAVPFGS